MCPQPVAPLQALSGKIRCYDFRNEAKNTEQAHAGGVQRLSPSNICIPARKRWPQGKIEHFTPV